MRIGEEVVVLITVLGVFAIVIVSLFLRHKRQHLRYQERLAAMERSLPVPFEPPPSYDSYLLRGLIWLFSGSALALFLLTLSLTNVYHRDDLEERLRRSRNLTELGATEEQVKQAMARMDSPPRREPPLPVALIGLIPIGVGAAYLIVYRSEQRRAAILPPPPGTAV